MATRRSSRLIAATTSSSSSSSELPIELDLNLPPAKKQRRAAAEADVSAVVAPRQAMAAAVTATTSQVSTTVKAETKVEPLATQPIPAPPLPSVKPEQYLPTVNHERPFTQQAESQFLEEDEPITNTTVTSTTADTAALAKMTVLERAEAVETLNVPLEMWLQRKDRFKHKVPQEFVLLIEQSDKRERLKQQQQLERDRLELQSNALAKVLPKRRQFTEKEQVTPPDFTLQLLPYQKFGLYWMQEREASHYSPAGGILADEQGLGKTIEIIALMASKPPPRSKLTKNGEREPWRSIVIVPMSLLGQWKHELQRCITYPLKIHVYHGTTKMTNPHLMARYDVILTTYQTLASECPFDKKSGKSPLFRIIWHRIILDEAGVIKNAASVQSVAVSMLHGNYRWCLTGTPIQNSVNDVFALFRFLRLKPYCKKSEFEEFITHNLQTGTDTLRTTLFDSCLWRRKTDKNNGEPILQLPNRHIDVMAVTLSDAELAAYEALEKEHIQQFLRLLRIDCSLKFYTRFLSMLSELRCCCNDPMLVPRIAAAVSRAKAIQESEAHEQSSARPAPVAQLRRVLAGPAAVTASSAPLLASLSKAVSKRLTHQPVASHECPICLDTPADAVMTRCGHVYCRDCIVSHIENPNNPHDESFCPACRSACSVESLVEYDNVHAEIARLNHSVGFDDSSELEEPELVVMDSEVREDIPYTPLGTTSKVAAVMKLLLSFKKEDPNMKCLIFSQWSKTLFAIKTALAETDLQHCRFDGTLSAQERSEVISIFNNDADVKVLLCSLKAAGLGLNLQTACRVILVDPWWNPSIEEQAVDRVHRIGQTSDVRVTRIIALNTIEERLIKIQEKKRQLLKAFAAGNDSQLGRTQLSLTDIANLFGFSTV